MTCIDITVPLEGLTTADLLLLTRWAHDHRADLAYADGHLVWVVDLDALRNTNTPEAPEPDELEEPPAEPEPEPEEPEPEPPAPKKPAKKPARNGNVTDTTATIRAWFDEHHQWAGTIRDFAERLDPDSPKDRRDRTVVAVRNLVNRGHLTPIREGNRIVGLKHPNQPKPKPTKPAKPTARPEAADPHAARRARAAAAAYDYGPLQ